MDAYHFSNVTALSYLKMATSSMPLFGNTYEQISSTLSILVDEDMYSSFIDPNNATNKNLSGWPLLSNNIYAI